MRFWLPMALVAVFTAPASAEEISNPVALFSGLDKITALTTNFEDKVGQEVAFGTLTVKTLTCLTRPITEQPKTTAFVQVDASQPDGSKKRIFSGWMFAESPGLNAVEHPVFDVWLTGCFDPAAPPPPVETTPQDQAVQPAEGKDQPED
jgi:hypothetical protein